METPTKDLKTATLQWLELWMNEKNTKKGLTYLSPSMTFTHDDDTRNFDEWIKAWSTVMSMAPGIKHEVIDAVQEGRKVWVYGRISGLPGGVVNDSVDMFEWDTEGEKMIKVKDVQRAVKL